MHRAFTTRPLSKVALARRLNVSSSSTSLRRLVVSSYRFLWDDCHLFNRGANIFTKILSTYNEMHIEVSLYLRFVMSLEKAYEL